MEHIQAEAASGRLSSSMIGAGTQPGRAALCAREEEEPHRWRYQQKIAKVMAVVQAVLPMRVDEAVCADAPSFRIIGTSLKEAASKSELHQPSTKSIMGTWPAA